MAYSTADLTSDLEGFELAAEVKPDKTSGVTVSQMPETLVKMLAEHAPKALADDSHELVLRVPVRFSPAEVKGTPDEKAKLTAANAEAKAEAEAKATATVKLLAGYATAWGKGQEPKLYITKTPNRKDMPNWHARLSVKKWDDVPTENRPGRR